MKWSQVLILFACSMAASTSWGFFHFEPGIGYNRGHYQTSKAQGLGLSAKVGFDWGNAFITADVGYHDLQLGSTPTSTLTDTGLCIGYDFKAYRIWYTHLVSADLEIESSGSATTYTGDGMKLGMSGAVSRTTNLNFEMRFIDFTERSGASSGAVNQFMDSAFISVSWVL